jgi:hypothetical protein
VLASGAGRGIFNSCRTSICSVATSSSDVTGPLGSLVVHVDPLDPPEKRAGQTEQLRSVWRDVIKA